MNTPKIYRAVIVVNALIERLNEHSPTARLADIAANNRVRFKHATGWVNLPLPNGVMLDLEDGLSVEMREATAEDLLSFINALIFPELETEGGHL